MTGERVMSAGVVVVRAATGGWRVLLLRAYTYWDCPKGVVEPGEDPLATARREVREETGIASLTFDWGERFIETPPYSRNKVARYYLARTTEERVVLGIDPALGRPEHHEARWLDFEEAHARAGERLRRVLDWAHATVSAP